jgi:hypothetical protein
VHVPQPDPVGDKDGAATMIPTGNANNFRAVCFIWRLQEIGFSCIEGALPVFFVRANGLGALRDKGVPQQKRKCARHQFLFARLAVGRSRIKSHIVTDLTCFVRLVQVGNG